MDKLTTIAGKIANDDYERWDYGYDGQRVKYIDKLALADAIEAALRDAYRAGLERAAQIAEAAENDEGDAYERLCGLAERIRGEGIK